MTTSLLKIIYFVPELHDAANARIIARNGTGFDEGASALLLFWVFIVDSGCITSVEFPKFPTSGTIVITLES